MHACVHTHMCGRQGERYLRRDAREPRPRAARDRQDEAVGRAVQLEHRRRIHLRESNTSLTPETHTLTPENHTLFFGNLRGWAKARNSAAAAASGVSVRVLG